MQIDRQRLDPPPVHLAHSEYCAAGDHAVADDRQAAKDTEHVAADRGEILVGDGETEVLVQLPDVRAPRYQRIASARV
jgi:hypothetical protein